MAQFTLQSSRGAATMHPLLRAIRDTPLDFLPEPSLKAFMHFRGGYFHRLKMEGQNVNWQYDRRDFHKWLCGRFQLQFAEPVADTALVASFSSSEEDAFRKYFALLEEYLGSEESVEQSSSIGLEKMNFARTLKAIRQRPGLYIGYPTFLGCCSYLRGDEQAHQDLELTSDEGQEIFRNFQEWVEQEKNQAGQKRPWFKIIEFWSGGIDCGHTASGAWSLFWKWLDQYTKLVGKEQLFGAPTDNPKMGGVQPS
jgi:hypothetical protein